MDQKFKVLFNIFNQYLLKSNCVSAEFELGESFDIWSGNKFFCSRSKSSGTYLTPPIPIFDEISEYVKTVVESEQAYYSEEGEEFYNYNFVILPEDRVIELYGAYSIYSTEDGTEQVIEEKDEPDVFEEIFEYLDDLNADILEVDVNAGGDSGWIEDTATDVNGQQIDVTEEMKNVGYRLLNNYPGWEINEGSTAKFIWDRHRRILIFEFAYNTEEQTTDLISKEKF